jgi:uncharacterized tellurite resistance protein B-like protein
MSAGAQWEADVLTAMILMALADDQVIENEVTRVRALFGKLAGLTEQQTPSEADVREAFDRIRAEGPQLDDFLVEVGRRLDAEGTRCMLQAAYVIATADGKVVDAEDAMLVRIARALGIEPETYRALLTHFNVERALR